MILGPIRKFNIERIHDMSYAAPYPWDEFDSYFNCWGCRQCGAIAPCHNDGCRLVQEVPAVYTTDFKNSKVSKVVAFTILTIIVGSIIVGFVGAL